MPVPTDTPLLLIVGGLIIAYALVAGAVLALCRAADDGETEAHS